MSENFTYQPGDQCTGGSSPLYRSGTDLGCTCCSYKSGSSMFENFTDQSGDHIQEVARLCIVLELFLVVHAVVTTVVHRCPRISLTSQEITV